MKPKKKSSLEMLKSAFRRVWHINPVQQTVPSKKVYDRKNFKTLNKGEQQ
jgi:hypothetical protein